MRKSENAKMSNIESIEHTGAVRTGPVKIPPPVMIPDIFLRKMIPASPKMQFDSSSDALSAESEPEPEGARSPSIATNLIRNGMTEKMNNDLNTPSVIRNKAMLSIAQKTEAKRFEHIVKNAPDETVKEAFGPLADIVLESRNYLKDNEDTDSTGKGSDWVLITINPEGPYNGARFAEFYSKCQRAFNKKWIKVGIFCMEQRSKISDGKPIGDGFHMHMAVRRGNKRPSEIEREFRNTFMGLCGNVKHVDFRWGVMRDWDNVVNYVKGMRKGLPKDTSEADKQMREAFKIKDFYTKGMGDEVIPEPTSDDDF